MRLDILNEYQVRLTNLFIKKIVLFDVERKKVVLLVAVWTNPKNQNFLD